MFEFGMLVGFSLTAGWLIRALIRADYDGRRWMAQALPLHGWRKAS